MKRRNSIKRQRKKEQHSFETKNIIYLWQILISSLLSIFLFNLFIGKSTTQINPKNLIIKGNVNFDKELIISQTGINFPATVLQINPKQIESNLTRELALEAVSVSRKLIPPELIISILERKPVAFSQRNNGSKMDYGMIDKDAYWIPLKRKKEDLKELNLVVKGWRPRYRNSISLIIKYKNDFGSPLEEINFDPTGELSLKTINIDSIKLGTDQEKLLQQIKTLSYLSEVLPESFYTKKGFSIDLRDLAKPELQTGGQD